MTTESSPVMVATGGGSDLPQDTGSARATAGQARVEVLVLASVALGAVGQLLLKASLLLLSQPPILKMEPRPAQIACAAGVLVGLCIYAVGTAFWVRAVSRSSISYLYPLSAVSYAVVALGGHELFGEVMPPLRWVGIAVMSIGVAVLAASEQRGPK